MCCLHTGYLHICCDCKTRPRNEPLTVGPDECSEGQRSSNPDIADVACVPTGGGS